MPVGPAVEVRVTSSPFAEVFDRLRAAITARGLTLFDVIDHQAAAVEAGLTLRPTRVLMFGSPAAGTPLMVRWPALALELPLRILIWEGEDNRTHVGYYPAEAVVGFFGLDPAKVGPLHVPNTVVDDVMGDG